MDNLAQDLTLGSRIKFLLIHMMQMEMLVVLLGTSLVALLFYTIYKKQNNRLAEQIFSRNLAAAYTSLALVLWLAERMLR